MELKGRVAVVTGGASGIGRGMTEAFLDEGMKVVIGDIEREALDETVAELKAAGGEVTGAICDVSSQDSLDALAKTTLDAYGAVHVLCNNAGVAGDAGPVWDRSLEDWDWVMGVNVLGVLHGIRSFVPIMIEQDDEGHIVNTASIAGLIAGGANDLNRPTNAFGGQIGIQEGSLGMVGQITIFGNIDGGIARILDGRMDDGVINTGRVRAELVSGGANIMDAGNTPASVGYDDGDSYHMAFRL